MKTIHVVGQMLVRNEADVVEEVVREAFRWVEALVVLDGASTDGTTEILSGLAATYRRAGKLLMLCSRDDPDGRFADHYRNELLELTSVLQPDWVMSVDGDEIYDAVPVTPVDAIVAADEAGANVVRCWVPEFWLAFDDLRKGALHEEQAASVQERRRWYSWGHAGTFIWKWNDAHFYPKDTPKRTPELPGADWRDWQRAGPLMPICKHYPIRGLEQGLVRMRQRLTRGGRRYFGKYALNWIVDERVAGLHYFDGEWKTIPNHRRLRAYMAGGSGGGKS